MLRIAKDVKARTQMYVNQGVINKATGADLIIVPSKITTLV